MKKDKGSGFPKQSLLLLSVTVIIILAILLNPGAAFQGSDSLAEEVILEISPDTVPWFEPIWEPPSGEIESLLFALQAAIGAGVICYFLGYWSGSKKVKAVH